MFYLGTRGKRRERHSLHYQRHN